MSLAQAAGTLTAEDLNPAISDLQKVSDQDDLLTDDAFDIGDDGVWVANSKLDTFMSISGELIVLKNFFDMMAADANANETSEKLKKRLSEFSHGLNKITDQLQDQIMSVRQVSLNRTFSRVPQMIQQAAESLGKKAVLSMNGTELGVDKNIAKSLSTSIVHIIRNALDHGIELPQVRTQNGKTDTGKLTISASEQEGVIRIQIDDDGAGIDTGRVLKKAIQRGLVTTDNSESLSESDIFDLLFHPDLSTKDEVDESSPRGVGMDAVKSSMLIHHGRIKITSRKGTGTSFLLEIPVPRSVMVERTILAKSNDVILALPLTAVTRIMPCRELKISTIKQNRFFQYNGQTVRLSHYHELIQGSDDTNTEENLNFKTVVILQHKHELFGLITDSIEGQLEAVIRPFDSIINELPGLGGTTVLGNDAVAYIVNPEEILKLTKCSPRIHAS